MCVEICTDGILIRLKFCASEAEFQIGKQEKSYSGAKSWENGVEKPVESLIYAVFLIRASIFMIVRSLDGIARSCGSSCPFFFLFLQFYFFPAVQWHVVYSPAVILPFYK